MAVAGVARVKDEADIIATTVLNMLAQVDFVIVADNASTDGTRDILAELDIDVVDDPDIAYLQSDKMTGLARRAAARGATWVVPFDADEIWYSPFGRIADLLAAAPASILTAALYDHVATGADPERLDPVERLGWRRRQAAPLQKIAARTRLAGDVVIHQGNHDAHFDSSGRAVTADRLDGQLVVRHYPYRSVEQFERKVRNGAAAYAATDLPEHVGAHWRGYGRILDEKGPEELAGVFRQWFFVAYPQDDPALIYDPAPLPCRPSP